MEPRCNLAIAVVRKWLWLVETLLGVWSLNILGFGEHKPFLQLSLVPPTSQETKRKLWAKVQWIFLSVSAPAHSMCSRMLVKTIVKIMNKSSPHMYNGRNPDLVLIPTCSEFPCSETILNCTKLCFNTAFLKCWSCLLMLVCFAWYGFEHLVCVMTHSYNVHIVWNKCIFYPFYIFMYSRSYSNQYSIYQTL